MIVTHLLAKNWRNFRHIDVALRERQFIVGPNAAGKSNFLDLFRFLRDIAKSEGGGLQKALKDRGGVPKVRSLAARKDPEIAIQITLGDTPSTPALWRYALGIKQEARGLRLPFVSYERVWRDGEQVLDRPDGEDNKDPARLTQTFLEQIGANSSFRDIARFLQAATYLHLVPQLLRFADVIQGRIVEDDPFGQSFLERIARTTDKTRRARLRIIEEALKVAVPQLQQLQFTRDSDTGRPHLQALYSHWRPNAGWQQEDQFSDGTLRLIGLLWSLLEGDSLLLLEEPELSLNSGIVAQFAPLVARLQRPRKRQVIVSTHSEALLTERGIDGKEVLLLTPETEGTRVVVVSELSEVRSLLEAGFTVGEAVLPKTRPTNPTQLALLD
ncbi:MAG: AAA family ATPase [Gammaproteobacteria bacterium]|nr:AAA family ATPase [Gammaproteobacteria bacterium]MBI5615067.1 AAA family ATPase [Gammaproteobacteria bacterium]